MRRLQRNSTIALLVLAGVLYVSAGCSSRQRAVVKGEVVFFDKKLTTGTVSFETQDGKRIGTGNIDFNGHYTVNDAPVGPCTVTVRVPRVPTTPLGQKMIAPKAPGNMPPMRPPGGEDSGDSGVSLIDPTKIVTIPGKYAKAETSGLTFTVAPGENTFDITLTP